MKSDMSPYFCDNLNMPYNVTGSADGGWGLISSSTENFAGEWYIACNISESGCSKWAILCSTLGGQLVVDTTEDGGGEWDIATNDFRMYFQIINFVFICQIIALFGTGANIINLICFAKQGFKDPVNISFLGLTISDLMSLLALVWQNISVNPLLYETDIPFDPEQTVYLTAGVPHLAFTRVTGWITAFITLERCLCITHPLKVKNFLTRKRVIIIISSIFVLIVTSNFAPSYYTIPFMVTDHPYLNRTWIGLQFTMYRRPIERYAFGLNGICLPFCAFAVVVVSTIILVVKLKSKTKWRAKSTAAGSADKMSSRDRSVSRMVVSISTIFIVCYIPVCFISIAMIIEPKLSIDGTFGNAFAIVFSFVYILESVNSSFNIFIYYHASSRYKAIFREIFCKDKSNKNKTIASHVLTTDLHKKTVK